MKKMIYLMLVTASVLAGCKKHSVEEENSVKDIYIAGYTTNSAGNHVATYWKNGEPFYLTTGYDSSYVTTEINSIYVSGKDVYAAGFGINKWGRSQGFYWVNEVGYLVTDQTVNGAARSLVRANGRVHVCGMERTNAMYWNNGARTILTDSLTAGEGKSIFASGKDIYIAGYQLTGGRQYARYWKNDVGVDLTDGSHAAQAFSICVNGQDVYVCGYDNLGARYWKNGTPVLLTNENTFAIPYSITYANDKVYTAGQVVNQAVYWEGEFKTDLGDGVHPSSGNGISVSGNTVYVVGFEKNAMGVSVAKYWKNGVGIPLTSTAGDAVATSIFIVE